MDSTKQDAGKREGISMPVKFPEMVGTIELRIRARQAARELSGAPRERGGSQLGEMATPVIQASV